MEGGKMEGNQSRHFWVSRLSDGGRFKLLLLAVGNIAIWLHFGWEREG